MLHAPERLRIAQLLGRGLLLQPTFTDDQRAACVLLLIRTLSIEALDGFSNVLRARRRAQDAALAVVEAAPPCAPGRGEAARASDVRLQRPEGVAGDPS